jgi:diaminohydroxyphosphoribosylaminopyrimidine deaminase / 5-amino-6-(5-phosphoribosylamino)uracil reductase
MDAPPGFSAQDGAFMARALDLARARLGQTAPNPAVGCVLVRDGQIVGQGATQPGGRPHAEAVALAEAGERARGATAYVSLEPCAHVSARGIARLVAAMQDPDPRTAGAGLSRLADAGVSVACGLMEAEARAVNAGFLKRLATGRPWVGVSADASGWDGDFVLGFKETFEQALDRMGREGLTRVRVAPGSPLALALSGRKLLDQLE